MTTLHKGTKCLVRDSSTHIQLIDAHLCKFCAQDELKVDVIQKLLQVFQELPEREQTKNRQLFGEYAHSMRFNALHSVMPIVTRTNETEFTILYIDVVHLSAKALQLMYSIDNTFTWTDDRDIFLLINCTTGKEVIRRPIHKRGYTATQSQSDCNRCSKVKDCYYYDEAKDDNGPSEKKFQIHKQYFLHQTSEWG